MIEVNLISVLLAAIGAMAVGFFWYSQMFLGKPWMKMMGYTAKDLKKEQQSMGMYYAMSFGLALLTAYVLSHVMALSSAFYDYGAVQTGITSALFMWLGFVMPVQATEVIFGKSKNWNLWAINTGYQLTSLIVMGIVLGMMG